MTTRRQITGTTGGAISVADTNAITITTTVNGTQAGLDRLSAFSWEDWFFHANAQQRAEALGLAQQQGILYPSQLAHVGNGTKSTTANHGSESGLVQTLTRLLAGKTDTIAPYPLQPISFFDAGLDECQQQAVVRAVNSPDVFLLQGLPGTGKSRVLAEVILQAAARGWRVLFLAAKPASLDVVLHRLIGRQDVFAIRYLDPAEKLESLPAWLRGLTPDEQRQSFLERILLGARQNCQQAEVSCQKRREEEPLWNELRHCLEQAQTLDTQLAERRQRLAHVDAEVEAETKNAQAETPFSARAKQLRQSFDQKGQENESTLKLKREALVKADQEMADLVRRVAELEPAFLAKKENRLWTWSYWQQMFAGNIVLEMESLQNQQSACQTRQQELTRELAVLEPLCAQQEAIFAAEQQKAIAAEVQARQQALRQEIESLEEKRKQREEAWQNLSQRLMSASLEPTHGAIEAAQQTWLQHKKNIEEHCQFAREWTDFVEATGPQLAGRLPGLANVLAGTLTAWHKEKSFLDATANGSFDTLIVEDADTLTESDLLNAARKVQRCVLVGHTISEFGSASKTAEKTSRSFISPLVSTVCWPRLWQTLGGDAPLWQSTWFREQERLVCQLIPLSKEDRQYVDREELVDAAEIELRILNRPKATPRLAQMVFPADWSFAQAFTMIVREAQELPLQPLSKSGWWQEDSLRWRWRTAPSSQRVRDWLDLESGVRLGTVACSGSQAEVPRLACIEFEKSDGWDQRKAEAWLDRHQAGQDPCRTLFLQNPYRFVPPLTKSIVSLVCPHDWLGHDVAALTDDSAFEFCPVPPCESDEWPRDGAGLEQDLSAPRQGDRLPAEFRHGLPSRGFINYQEAKAVVRRLESLAQDGEINTDGASCRVAVLALYESQAELLRRMIARSEVLRSSTFSLEVSLPSQMHQRECDIALLSLTRSHSHRCGAFGEDVRELPLALTRARSRILVFGDIGMLSKRTHWTGPLDHLDAHASQQESLRLCRLFAHVQRQAKALVVSGVANGRS